MKISELPTTIMHGKNDFKNARFSGKGRQSLHI